jgi:hypothetical protein
MIRGSQETRLSAYDWRARSIEGLTHQERHKVRSQGEACAMIHWIISNPRESWTVCIPTCSTAFARWCAQHLPRVAVEMLRTRPIARLGGRTSICGARPILPRVTAMHSRHASDAAPEMVYSLSSRTVGAPFITGGYLGARERDTRELPRAIHDMSFISGRNEKILRG